MEDNKVTLKEHIETRLVALEKATEVAARLMEHRLQGMNEFRVQLKEKADHFVTHQEYDAVIDGMVDDIRELREAKATQEGKASQMSVNIAYIISIIGLIISIVSLVWKMTH
jgi:hypothetical protein